MVSKKIYMSIFTVGSVFCILAFLTDLGNNTALTIEFLTIFTILTIKFIEEWHYYRSYNAALASAIFITIPAIILIGGSLFSRMATLRTLLETETIETTIIGASLNLIGLGLDTDFFLYFNIFSLTLIFPYLLVLLILINKYYSDTYPAFFVFRKRFPKITVFFYNIAIDFFLVLTWVQSQFIELNSLAFVITTIAFILYYYVFIAIKGSRESPTTTGISPTPVSSLSTTNSNLRNNSSNVNSNADHRRTTRTTRTTTAVPSATINRTSRVRPTRTTSNRTNRRERPTIQVVPGVQVNNSPSRYHTKHLSASTVKKLMPRGQHLTDDDFRCIFCYEFPIQKEKKVIICPHCGHPAHEDEFQRWRAISNICSRCNKEIKEEKIIRISGAGYQKVINIFKKKSSTKSRN